MSDFTRRQFIQTAGAAAAAFHVTRANAGAEETKPTDPVDLQWLEGSAPTDLTGTAWGIPWPRGAARPEQTFQASGDVPLQSWPLAYWPDGSLKWTGHAIAGGPAPESLTIATGAPSAPAKPVAVAENADSIVIDTGVIRCRISKTGAPFITVIERGGVTIAKDGQLVCLRQDRQEPGLLRHERFAGAIDKAAVEQSGPVRAVVKLEGRHHHPDSGRAWLPFTLRLYFYANGDAIRLMHSFVFDGDAKTDFIHGLGLSFAVPMRDALHDRHVRFAGDDGGLWAEAVRNLTGLRRDAGPAVIGKQLAGEACPPVEEFPAAVRDRLGVIPAWGDYTLFQPTADSFTIQKRTAADCCWITADHGKRAAGFGYLGGPSGGLAFGLRDFWQRHPTGLDIRGAAGAEATATIWFWSPEAQPMDLRFYHDGMGMDTHPKEIEGLEITYEDYEKGFDTATGIARSSEVMLWACAATPNRRRLVDMASAAQKPPLLTTTPEYRHATGVFGPLWALPDRTSRNRARVEDQLDWYAAFYRQEVDKRHWYGFWNYGDVMHTYDRDRHVWRYDVGGFAWDNSELSTDLWLWYSFIRTGSAETFRLAEAMTRHTGEVDVYHSGRFAGLGTRHGVVHWGDSAKQMRISTGAYRRFYHYLTADERVGDLLREVVDADTRLAEINPVRKLPGEPAVPAKARMSVGTDFGSAAINWLIEWERTGDARPRAWLEKAMRAIGGSKYGFLTEAYGYDPATKEMQPLPAAEISVSHLSAVFGLAEICAELISLIDVPEFEKAWLKYCTLYNASAEEQIAAVGQKLTDTTLNDAHSRLTAYAAWKTKDPALAQRAWKEFLGRHGDFAKLAPAVQRVEVPAALHSFDEAPSVSTNGTAQWGLAAIQNLCLIGDQIPTTAP